MCFFKNIRVDRIFRKAQQAKASSQIRVKLHFFEGSFLKTYIFSRVHFRKTYIFSRIRPLFPDLTRQIVGADSSRQNAYLCKSEPRGWRITTPLLLATHNHCPDSGRWFIYRLKRWYIQTITGEYGLAISFACFFQNIYHLILMFLTSIFYPILISTLLDNISHNTKFQTSFLDHLAISFHL